MQNADRNIDHTHKEITRSRSAVLSYILKLKKCIDARHTDLLETLIKRFSESTIDYISYGHFRLLDENQLEPHQHAALSCITQQVLTFEERYSVFGPVQINSLQADLESLALALEARFEIEDEYLNQAFA